MTVLEPASPTRPGASEDGSSRTGESTGLSVYEQIKAMILANRIPPGTKVNLDRLARSLGVSQTPVREAVQRLEGDKLVLARRQPRGYWTTPLLDELELHHMFEVRMLIEPWTARTAAGDRGVNPGRAMLAEIERFQASPVQGERGYRLAAHDATFHDALFRAAGNSFLTDAYRQIHAHLHLIRLYPADLDGEQTVAEHRRIAEAVLATDADGAENAMREHLLTALERFSVGLTAVDREHGLHQIRTGVVRPPR